MCKFFIEQKSPFFTRDLEQNFIPNLSQHLECEATKFVLTRWQMHYMEREHAKHSIQYGSDIEWLYMRNLETISSICGPLPSDLPAKIQPVIPSLSATRTQCRVT